MSAINIQNGLGVNSIRRRSLSTASSAALMVLAASGAYAQDTGTETVTVSSTRIINADFVAPTPTTAIGAADLVKQANTNVFATITELPSLQGSTGSSVGNGGSSNGVNGLSALNLRNIGTNRNLVLVDGERVVPASIQGVVDISQLPQLLISRVDVVTGGASASWGSDAVSGVVNFILDKKFEGFKANLSGGMTTYADDPQAQFQFAAGTSFFHGRIHWELSGEFTSEAGVDSMTGPRSWWQNPQQLQMYSAANCTPGNASANACATSGAPMWMNVNNGYLAQWTTGGLITRGPLQGTAFGPNGTTYQFNYGYGFGVVGGVFQQLPAVPVKTNIGSGAITNCSGGGYCFGGDATGNQTGYGALVARLVRGNAYTRVGFDLTPDISIYMTGMWSEVFTWDKPTQSFFKNDNLQLGCDNPFLPASVTAVCYQQNGQNGAFNAGYGQPGSVGNAYTFTNSGTPTAQQEVVCPAAVAVASGCVNGYYPIYFPAGRIQIGELNSQLKSVANYNDRQLGRLVLGSEGVFNLFGTDWNFKGYLEHGEVHYFNMLENILETPYYNAAIDAVGITSGNQNDPNLRVVPIGSTDFTTATLNSDPTYAIGSIICRSPQARSVGCAPADLIGPGQLSPAADAFIQGTPNGSIGTNTGRQRWPWQVVHQRQEVFDYGMSGEPLEDWAGKISIFGGIQYREEAFNIHTDCASRGNCANDTYGGMSFGAAGNPLLTPAGAGIPGVFGGLPLPPLAPTPNYYAGNFQQTHGNFHEYEASVESNVPLLNDQEWGRINLDLAGRETVYSTSGWVSTWKVGLTWDTPVDGLRLRALQSRDVRAPNLAELFGAPRVNNGSVTDDFNITGLGINQSVSPLPNPIVANANLKPERGATTELGFVYSPDWFPGLNTSVTYYRIGVKGEVANFSQQQQMDACYNNGAPGATPGALAQCAFFLTNGVSWVQNGVLTSVPTTAKPTSQITPLFNVASVVTDGVDYEIDYRFSPDDFLDWGMGGNITLRALATNVTKFITNPGIAGVPIIETAGSNASGVPHWKMFFTESYDAERWGLFVNERYFTAGYINHNWVQCNPGSCPVPVDGNHPTVNTNNMPSEFYLDVGGHYDLTPMSSLYFKIDNVANQSPDNAYSYGPANQGPNNQPNLYDVLGRFYHIGIRIND